MSDDYLRDAAWEHWDMILQAYTLHEEHKPIVLFDIQEQRIYVYPYKDFKEELNPGTQASLQGQYEQAVATNKIVVFVRDNVNRRLVSYSFDYLPDPNGSPGEAILVDPAEPEDVYDPEVLNLDES